ncbi:phospholipid/cholesterol/gamma-HCH transport system substrate-binding protein [Thermomonospora echinospora]|uniref:Phospholipid/cholesterol/gamma-HCH transport system substrate-binding protein n=1 Tax=Thermomonospora echinospora TaxID=1992 RepID=A0A1H5XAQ4_9ACTN|nr:MCE family protein [Thermomonospora echinospora]SEG08844.1 phospholipid/cholesterol/gamma-HCH transport system substrate-binding protein [Thermomonospora echinospora]
MNHEIPLRRALLVSLLTLVIVAVGGYALVARPFRAEGTRLTAEFGRAGQGLGDGAPVKIRGVTVGSVERAELTGAGRARLTLRLDPGVRVPTSATASIEPASAFGPKFVDLVPGAGERGGPYLASGATIARTSDPQDLSDLLSDADATLRAVDATEVATIVRTLAQGLNGQGGRLRATIDHTSTLMDVAYRRRSEARRFLHDAAGLTGALAGAGSGDDLITISGDANTLIAGTAAGGRDRLGQFADQLSEISALVSHGFDKRGGQLGQGFRSGERAAALVYAQLGLAGNAVRTANGLLPLYGELTSMPGPEGKNYMRAQGLLPTDPCQLIIGLCGSTGGR